MEAGQQQMIAEQRRNMMDKNNLVSRLQEKHMPYLPFKKQWVGASGILKCIGTFLLIHLVLSILLTLLYVYSSSELLLILQEAQLTHGLMVSVLVASPIVMIVSAIVFRGRDIDISSLSAAEVAELELINQLAIRGVIFIILGIILSIIATIFIKRSRNKSIQHHNENIRIKNQNIEIENQRIDARNQAYVQEFYSKGGTDHD